MMTRNSKTKTHIGCTLFVTAFVTAVLGGDTAASILGERSALGGNDYTLPWHTVDGGGAMFTTAVDFELSATAGQVDAGVIMTGGQYELAGGFWVGTGLVTCPGDVDSDGDVDVSDLLILIAMWGPCADCPADIDMDGEVDVQDLLALITLWGPC